MPRRRQQDEYDDDYEDEDQQEEQEDEDEGQYDSQEEEDEHTWEYSECNGNRKALLAGINYFGESPGELRGCINDVMNIKEFLHSRGFEEDDMLILTDDQEDEELRPTKENMINGMQWLVDGAEPNDSLFFHFSGHGGPEEDEDGDEEDGFDESILPVDHQEVGSIVDDTMHEILVTSLPVGCRLTVIFDCCHSGSGLDLPYTYRDTGNIRKPSKKEQLETLKQHIARGDTDALALQVKALQLVESGEAAQAARLTKETRHSDADVIFFSGCLDAQTSADAVIDEQNTGALSHALVKVLYENSEISYRELLIGIREFMEEKGLTQIPQLSSSHPYDINLSFAL
ncbi:metacaspase [Coprinopsis marcescibilis]|uniref:Metacaspase n=1 Tax=Coprinopsis marcescibilis TaxID=230819 RepID=A0A5C3KG70_COPMA|nr:metacaspase [Coprinopsis marcescibilis]